MTTSSEFAEWQEYLLQEEEHAFNRTDHYLAQIACEIVRGRVKDPSKVKPDQFMLKFVRQTPKAKRGARKDPKTRLKESKAAWGIAAMMPLK